MKIYTKKGDSGYTGLIGGQRIIKSDPRIVAYGSVDELNSFLGLSISFLSQHEREYFQDIIKVLTTIQNELFIIGSDLANPNSSESKSLGVKIDMINKLEKVIDSHTQELPPITYFIIPGGSIESSYLHIARSVTRRVETNIVKLSSNEKIDSLILIYLNRLSDLLFVLARIVNKRMGIIDVAWKY